MKPGIKIRVPDSVKEKITTFDRYGRRYYNLYYDSKDVVKKKIDSVLNRYKLRGISIGITDDESLEIKNRFNRRKQQVFEEYRGDFFAGELFDMRGRPSFRRLLSMLNNTTVTEQYIFNRIVTSLENEKTIIDLKDAHERLQNYSKSFEAVLKNKINTILSKYESKLEEI